VPEGPETSRAADEVAAAVAGERAEEVVFGLARRRQLGAVLLDQTAVAGLGNDLRAEILFEAGVDPRRRACGVLLPGVPAVSGTGSRRRPPRVPPGR